MLGNAIKSGKRLDVPELQRTLAYRQEASESEPGFMGRLDV
jgi:hypothetical protein